jgi:hypothetical protein
LTQLLGSALQGFEALALVCGHAIGLTVVDLIAARYERVATILTSNLHFSEWGDALPDNRILGAATPYQLRHSACHLVSLGERFCKQKPIPESGEDAVEKSSQIAF